MSRRGLAQGSDRRQVMRLQQHVRPALKRSVAVQGSQQVQLLQHLRLAQATLRQALCRRASVQLEQALKLPHQGLGDRLRRR